MTLELQTFDRLYKTYRQGFIRFARSYVSEAIRKHAEWELSTRIASLRACDPEELFSSEIQEIVTETLRRLPAKTREIFLLSREENLSCKEIASRMKILNPNLTQNNGWN